MVAMTEKDMNAEEMQRAGRQLYSNARILYGDEIQGRNPLCKLAIGWIVSFFNNFVDGGTISHNPKYAIIYATMVYRQLKLWSSNQPPIFNGCSTRDDLDAVIRRLGAFETVAKFKEQRHVAL